MSGDEGKHFQLDALNVLFNHSLTAIISICPSLPTVSGARGGLFGAGGRFKGGTDPIMEKFNESIGFDKRLVVCLFRSVDVLLADMYVSSVVKRTL